MTIYDLTERAVQTRNGLSLLKDLIDINPSQEIFFKKNAMSDIQQVIVLMDNIIWEIKQMKDP